jgi:hypothetical protein
MFKLKLVLVAVLTFAVASVAVAQTKPVERPAAEIIAEGIVALVVGPFAIMYATGTGAFSDSEAAGYKSVCAMVKGKWVNGSCVGGNWLNVIGAAPKA